MVKFIEKAIDLTRRLGVGGRGIFENLDSVAARIFGESYDFMGFLGILSRVTLKYFESFGEFLLASLGISRNL